MVWDHGMLWGNKRFLLPEYLLLMESVEVFLAGVFLVGDGR